MLWAGAKADDDTLTRAAREAAERRGAAERKRLLYVALTRAEDWLILCGAGRAAGKPGTWYEALELGMDALGGAEALPGPDGLAGPVRRREDNPLPVAGPAGDMASPQADAAPARPAWLAPAPREERETRLTPSSLGEHVDEGGTGLGRARALLRGAAVHRLLEVLPHRSPADRAALAARLLAREFPDLPAGIAPDAVAEALAVLAAPFAAEVFGPDTLAEAGMALDLPAVAPGRMLGRIDRLAIGPDRVLVVDFKTDAQPPETQDGVPAAYLAQLGAYRAALAAIWPERLVEAAILWTRGPRLMRLDPARMDRALAEAAASRS
jgi:ATP-dependent helicase/nuclease subunit A